MATGLDLIDGGSQGIVRVLPMKSFYTDLVSYDAIVSRPDSFLLGEMETPWGSIKADILTQLACPEGFKYPDNAVPDSLVFYLDYGSWVGDGNSNLELDIWWLDKGRTLNNSVDYHTDIDVTKYCTLADSTKILTHRRIITAATRRDSISDGSRYLSIVRFPVKDEFMRRFFAYNNFDKGQDDFNKYIPGFYITTTFGGSTILNVQDIQVFMFYHYSYKIAGIRDTTIYTSKGFYGNSEVRQVNHIEWLENRTHPKGLLKHLQDMAHSDGRNFIVGPCGAYTEMRMPLRSFCRRIIDSMAVNGTADGDTLRPYINLAKVDVDVLNVYTGDEANRTAADWAQPASAMLLLKSYAVDDFFANYSDLSDTLAILSYLTSATDSTGDNLLYYYEYDLSPILTASVRSYLVDSMSVVDTLKMTLVPVDIETSSSGSITTVNPSQTISTTIIRGTEVTSDPLDMEVVFSGF